MTDRRFARGEQKTAGRMPRTRLQRVDQEAIAALLNTAGYPTLHFDDPAPSTGWCFIVEDEYEGCVTLFVTPDRTEFPEGVRHFGNPVARRRMDELFASAEPVLSGAGVHVERDEDGGGDPCWVLTKASEMLSRE